MKKYLLILIAIIIIIPSISESAMVEGVDWAWDATNKSVVWLKNTPSTAYKLAVSSLSSQRSLILNEPYGVRSAVSYEVEDAFANRLKNVTTSNLTKSIGSNLVAGLVMGVAFSCAENYIDWLISQGQDPVLHKKNGLPYKYVDGPMPQPSCPSGCISDPDITVVKGTYQTAAEATAARNSAIDGATCTLNSSGKYSYPCFSGTAGDGMYCVDANNGYYVFSRYALFWESESSQKKWSWLIAPAGSSTPTQVEKIATQEDVKKALENAYNDNPEKWVNAVNDALTDVSNGLKNLNSTILAAHNMGSGEATFPNAISNVYNSMNATNVTNTVNTITNNTEEQNNYNWINQATNADNAVTPDQIRLANEQALRNVLGDDVDVPTDTEPLIPEKLSLTTVLTSFMSSISNLPLANTMRGLTINAGGSSTVCMALPAHLGGTKCFDCSGWQGSLNGIGSILLAVTTLMSMVYVFRG